MYKIQYLNLSNDSIHLWRDWTELGEFVSIEKAITEIETQMNYCWEKGSLKCTEIDSDKVKIYKLTDCNVYKFRFIPSLWHVGLNDEA
jgi:hypothetical protein